MKILKVYAVGFTTIIKRFRLISLAYLSLLIPALMVALPFHSYFQKAMSQYISPGKLLSGFDYTAYSELMNFRGDEIKAVFSQSFWLLILYFFISIFITGAILHVLQDKERKAKFITFLTGGSKYFWRFFRLSIIFLIIHALVALILYIPFGIMVKNAFEHAATERSVFFLFLPFGIIHLFIAIYLWVVSNYTKFIIVHKGSRLVLKSIWEALKFVSAKFLGTYGLILLLFLFPLLLMMLYYKASVNIEVTSGLLIFMVFLMQQIYLWLREATRVWAYSSQFDYYLICNQKQITENKDQSKSSDTLTGKNDKTSESEKVPGDKPEG